MLAEDACWILDALVSAGNGKPASGIVPLLLAGHSARIAYEGSRFVRTKEAGVASLAALLQPEHAGVTARARHATKLFDDDKKSHEELLGEMRAYLDAHHAEFTGNACFNWARRFETDLGTFLLGRHILTVTPTIPFRLGEPPDIPMAELGPKVRAVSAERGQELLILSAVTGTPWNQQTTVKYTELGWLHHRDRKAIRRLPTRFEPDYPEELKLVLPHVQGELNTARLIVPATAGGHEDAAFRATVLTVYQALRTLEHVVARHPDDAHSQNTSRLRALLEAPATGRLLSDHGRQVRNRCMHYRLPGDAVSSDFLDPTAPMNGIVEALPDGRPFEAYRRDLTETLDAAALLMNTWNCAGHALSRFGLGS